MSYKCSDINKQTQDSPWQSIGDIALHLRVLKIEIACSFLCVCVLVHKCRILGGQKTNSKPLFFFLHLAGKVFFLLRGLWCQGYSEKILLFIGAHLLSKPITTAPMLGWMGEAGGRRERKTVHLLLIAKCSVSKEWRVNQKVKFSVQACVFCMTGCCK